MEKKPPLTQEETCSPEALPRTLQNDAPAAWRQAQHHEVRALPFTPGYYIPTHDHWKISMQYEITPSLARIIIKSLDDEIETKLDNTNFNPSFLNNKAKCRTQMLTKGIKTTPKNDIALWMAVLDLTIVKFEHQSDFI